MVISFVGLQGDESSSRCFYTGMNGLSEVETQRGATGTERARPIRYIY